MADPVPADWAEVEARITAYLSSGGLFNPEMAIHSAVRDLLIDCRAALRAARENALEDAAKVAETACLVPPDGGSPAEDERLVCETAAARIRSLKSPSSASTKGEGNG